MAASEGSEGALLRALLEGRPLQGHGQPPGSSQERPRDLERAPENREAESTVQDSCFCTAVC